ALLVTVKTAASADPVAITAASTTAIAAAVERPVDHPAPVMRPTPGRRPRLELPAASRIPVRGPDHSKMRAAFKWLKTRQKGRSSVRRGRISDKGRSWAFRGRFRSKGLYRRVVGSPSRESCDRPGGGGHGWPGSNAATRTAR